MEGLWECRRSGVIHLIPSRPLVALTGSHTACGLPIQRARGYITEAQNAITPSVTCGSCKAAT